MPRSVWYMIVKEGAGHRVVAPLVGDSASDLEALARDAVDGALDRYLDDDDWNGHVDVALKAIPKLAGDAAIEAERARLEALLQRRVDDSGGATDAGRPIRVHVTVGLAKRRDEPVPAPSNDASAPPRNEVRRRQGSGASLDALEGVRLETRGTPKHHVVAHVDGDEGEIEARAATAVDGAIDRYLLDGDFDGRIVVELACAPIPKAREEALAAALQKRADDFGGVTVLGRKLRVELRVGGDDASEQNAEDASEHDANDETEDEDDDDDELASTPPPLPSLRSRSGPGRTPFDLFLAEGFTTVDRSHRAPVGTMLVVVLGFGLVTAWATFVGAPLYIVIPLAIWLVLLVVALATAAFRRTTLRLYADRLDVLKPGRRRAIPYASVDAFMVQSARISPDTTVRTLLVRFDPPRGGELLGDDGETYDEAIPGDFEPVGGNELLIALAYRLDRYRALTAEPPA